MNKKTITNILAISIKGKISHTSAENNPWQSNIQRNLYINNVLYSMSREKLQSNDIDSFEGY